ncbi:unnamed protein product [Prunus brigantina]
MSLSMHWLAPYIEKPNSSWVGLLGGEACSSHPRCKCWMSSNLLKLDFIHFIAKLRRKKVWALDWHQVHTPYWPCEVFLSNATNKRDVVAFASSILFTRQSVRSNLFGPLTHALRNYCENQPLPKAINC